MTKYEDTVFSTTDADEKLLAAAARWKHTRLAMWVTTAIAVLFTGVALVTWQPLFAVGFALCAICLFYSLAVSREKPLPVS